MLSMTVSRAPQTQTSRRRMQMRSNRRRLCAQSTRIRRTIPTQITPPPRSLRLVLTRHLRSLPSQPASRPHVFVSRLPYCLPYWPSPPWPWRSLPWRNSTSLTPHTRRSLPWKLRQPIGRPLYSGGRSLCGRRASTLAGSLPPALSSITNSRTKTARPSSLRAIATPCCPTH